MGVQGDNNSGARNPQKRVPESDFLAQGICIAAKPHIYSWTFIVHNCVKIKKAHICMCRLFPNPMHNTVKCIPGLT